MEKVEWDSRAATFADSRPRFPDSREMLPSEVGGPEDELLFESRRQNQGKKFAVGGVCCLALAAAICAVALCLRSCSSGPNEEEESRARPTEAYVNASKQYAADVARGKCDYAVPEENGTWTCFCQLARNEQCGNQACACAGGCGGDVLKSENTVTFANAGEVGECEESTALLTVPKSYFEDIDFLLQWCPTASRSLLVELMQNGFTNYQEQVAAGPVKQCVHAAKRATVPWLHVHTFCSEGFMEGLRKTGTHGWCGVIEHASQVPRMVDELVAWALGDGPLQSAGNFASCQSLGCGQRVPKPLCSCTKDCLTGENVTCCEDFSESCEL